MFFFKKTTVKSKNESSVGEDILIVSSQASEGNEDHQQSKPGPEEAGRQPKISPPPQSPAEACSLLSCHTGAARACDPFHEVTNLMICCKLNTG